ncbi:MAG TPA: YciI family protein [Candidatus Sulfopaludibacter sp.]|nr:YciI family protein [Candidatus Sulfopaludibacter sp.]
MRYMFLIYSQEVPGGPPAEEVAALMQGHAAVMGDAAAKGVLRGVDPLKSTASSTTVRMKDGQALITDGPFAETKEQLAGYYIIECPNLDDAIEWAKRIPTVCKGGRGCIEIRPIVDIRKPL